LQESELNEGYIGIFSINGRMSFGIKKMEEKFKREVGDL